MKFQPKFLTTDLADRAVLFVWSAVMEPKYDTAFFKPKRTACHIIVMVPEMQATLKDENVRNSGGMIYNYPDYPINPIILYERSFGDQKNEWTADYRNIAQCKALQLWHGRNDGRTDIMPHLLYSGDCPFWGGVKRDGIVVACSGVEPYFDRMIAGMVADLCIAGAYHAWIQSADKKEDRDTLS